MNEKFNDALSFVFKYLDNNDLENAALVCRSWCEIVKCENYFRGPICKIKRRQKRKYRESWFFIKTKIIKNYESRPCLQIFFTNDHKEEYFSDNCHCPSLPNNSYTILLECNSVINILPQQNILISLFIPKTSRTDIKAYTFTDINDLEYMFSKEQCFDCSPDKESLNIIKTVLEPNFKNDNSTKSFLIALYKTNAIYKFMDLYTVICEWFKKSKIDLWGGTTDMLLACQICSKNQFCNIDANYALIFVSNPTMNVYTEYLDNNCDSIEKVKEKLQNLKMRVKLKLHSIAFMYISKIRLTKFFEIDIDAFKTIFPNMSIFPICGEKMLIGNSLNDSYNKLINKEMYNDNTMSITILTYD